MIREILKNKYGKYSLSRVVPAVWFVYLLLSLTFVFPGAEIPKSYFEFTMIFCSVYVGKTAVDKIKENP